MTFDALFVPPALRSVVADGAWLRAMLLAERALARAQARTGSIPDIADEVFSEDGLDVEQLVSEGRRAGNPVAPLVRRLRERSADVHHGATSQDIMDTAAMLVARDARTFVLEELDGAAAACARRAEEHRRTIMAGRTLLQQAVPITFGLKAAGWLAGVVEARRALARVTLPAQLGGAAGTLAALGADALTVRELYARELGLAEPELSWHAIRLPVAQLGSALDAAASVCAKVALDIALLAQTEVAEVREHEAGPSSTMPQKRNPVGSTLARACAIGAHAAAGILTGGIHEHERAAGAWHAEWKALSDALALTGGAASWLRATLDGLEVDAEQMRANLHPETLAEAERFGGAQRPEDYLGSAPELIDRALARYRAQSE